MTSKIRVIEPYDTNFAPLGVLGYCLTQTNFLSPIFSTLNLSMKTVTHAPTQKLLDILVSILAGCRGISEVNRKIRPDLALAAAWGRDEFAEQSTLARTLNAFKNEDVVKLRQGSEKLFLRESRTLQHNFKKGLLWLDIDLMPLPVSKNAKVRTKGRQLARIMHISLSLKH